MRETKKSNAITLIALIITIIIMLILVAVTISILVKSNIIGIAENAADKTKTAYEKEAGLSEITIDGETYGSIDEYIDSKKNPEDEDTLPKDEDTLPKIQAGQRATETSEYSDGTKIVIIPKGFTVSAIKNGTADETTIDGGLVIYDIPAEDLEDGTVDWSDPETVKPVYNQFVWIPVEVNKTVEPVDTTTSISSFRNSYWEDSSDGGTRGADETDYIPDFDGVNGTGITAQKAELTESIYNYEGFYIGRYEAGSTTERTMKSAQTDPFVVQQDKYPYNYIKWGTNMQDVSSEGAVYLSNNLYAKTNTNYGATSMLCTSACWDAMLDFVKDSSHNVTSSTDWGNYADASFNITRGKYAIYSTTSYTLGSFQTITGESYKKQSSTESSTEKWVLLTTGATERNSSKNIYDVAGNCQEWVTDTPEGRYRALEGGHFSYSGSNAAACMCFEYDDPDAPAFGDDSSFRPVLYVK